VAAVTFTRGRREALRSLIGLVSSAIVLPCAAESEVDRALEQRVKAAFLFRFTEFVTWPDTAFPRPDAPFVMAVAGPGGSADAVAENLRAITAGHEVHGRAIEVKRVGASDPMPTAQVLYIAGTDANRVREIVRAAPRHALVVTEADGALENGSVINFVLAQDRVRFDASLDSAEKRGVKLSSRLLGVARAVRGSN
jgi:hypothetical protein